MVCQFAYGILLSVPIIFLPPLTMSIHHYEAKCYHMRVTGCVSFFCAACLLVRGGGDEPRDGTLAKRKGVVPRVKKREAQDAARRLARALESTRRGNLCLRRAVESGPSASDASRD